MRTAKKRIFECIENASVFGNGKREILNFMTEMIIVNCILYCVIMGTAENGGFLETLITTVMNNLQIYVRGVHIRFEDPMTNIDSPKALGLCVQSISLETTNRYYTFIYFLFIKRTF